MLNDEDERCTDAELLQTCNCKHWKPNKEKQFQSRIAEEQKTLDPFNKVRLLFLFTNLLLSLSLFLVLCLFLNSQFLIGHRLAVLDSIIKIQNSLHLPPFSQQPQNHLKKQENYYITRRRSELGLVMITITSLSLPRNKRKTLMV